MLFFYIVKIIMGFLTIILLLVWLNFLFFGLKVKILESLFKNNKFLKIYKSMSERYTNKKDNEIVKNLKLVFKRSGTKRDDEK